MTLSKKYSSSLSLSMYDSSFHLSISRLPRLHSEQGIQQFYHRYLLNPTLGQLFALILRWCKETFKSYYINFHTKIKAIPVLASQGENNNAALTSCRYEIATIYFNYQSKAHLELADSVHSACTTKAD